MKYAFPFSGFRCEADVGYGAGLRLFCGHELTGVAGYFHLSRSLFHVEFGIVSGVPFLALPSVSLPHKATCHTLQNAACIGQPQTADSFVLILVGSSYGETSMAYQQTFPL